MKTFCIPFMLFHTPIKLMKKLVTPCYILEKKQANNLTRPCKGVFLNSDLTCKYYQKRVYLFTYLPIYLFTYLFIYLLHHTDVLLTLQFMLVKKTNKKQTNYTMYNMKLQLITQTLFNRYTDILTCSQSPHS